MKPVPARRRLTRLTWRIRTLIVVVVALAVAGAGYGAYALDRQTPGTSTAPPARGSAGVEGTLSLTDMSRIMYVSTLIGSDYGRLAEVPRTDPGATPVIGSLSCERVYTAGGTLICLRQQGPTGGQYAQVYHVAGGALRLEHQAALPGTPSRARVSADGRLVAWTVFISGGAYSATAFTTSAGVMDVATGAVTSLTSFEAHVGGTEYDGDDVNFWGVTFTADDNTFYATMGVHGQTWLMRGDLRTRQLQAVLGNVECPSLSPDGTRIVFKKRVGSSLTAPWRLYVVDLSTLRETPLAETRSVDDQAAWLDDDTVAYAVPRADGTGYDIWQVPADGSGTPRLLIQNGSSPSSVGG